MTASRPSSRSGDTRLSVARAAARLFLERGFDATTGNDIAAASGVSERTLWRHFRNKENCVAPLFALSWQRFAEELRRWPRALAIEAHLAQEFPVEKYSPDEVEDLVRVVRLVAALPDEPDLRSVWLLSYHDGEASMAAVIGDRLGRSHHDYEVRLCAAAVMGAVRTVDETISQAVMRHGQRFTPAEVVAQMSRSIRAVANLPFCDPVASKPFGDAGPTP